MSEENLRDAVVANARRKKGAIPNMPNVPPPPQKPARIQAREDAEFEAREKLKTADLKLAEAIRAYEQAAPALMAVDFNRGLTVAQWAKALRIRQQEQQLEGA